MRSNPKVVAINAHGWAGYKSGCPCPVCRQANADRAKQTRANAKKRKADEAAALARAEAAASEASNQRFAEAFEDHLYMQHQELRARELEWERFWAEMQATEAQMEKSRERKLVEAAINAATDPERKVELANKLSKLKERESRTRARNQRLKARAKKAEAATPPAPVDDADEIFEITWPPAPAPLTHPAPTPEQPAAPEAPVAEPVTTLPPRVRPESGAGWTRTLSSAEPPTWYDARQGCWLGATEHGAVRAHRPEWSPESPELVAQLDRAGSLQFVGGAFVNPAKEKRAEDEAFLEYGRKCFGQ